MWRVQRPNSWCRVQILLLTMWSEILCSLSSSIAVADGRVLVVCHVSRSLLIVVIFDYLPQLARIDGIKYCCSAFFLVTAIVPSNWGSVSTLLLKGTYFLHRVLIYDNINNRTFWFYLNFKFLLKLRRRMIIARIIRSDCNLIKLGKYWLPLKTP